jgi:hypothetical protein
MVEDRLVGLSEKEGGFCSTAVHPYVSEGVQLAAYVFQQSLCIDGRGPDRTPARPSVRLLDLVLGLPHVCYDLVIL